MELSSDLNIEKALKTASSDLMPSMYNDDSVGPGQYDPLSSFPNGPYYSFPQAERFPSLSSPNPYFYSTLTPEKLKPMALSSNSRFISSPLSKDTRRSLCGNSDFPGPGQYDLPSTLYNKDFSIKGKLIEPKGTLTPGPGHYEPDIRKALRFPLLTDKKSKEEVSVTANVDYIDSDFKSSSPSFSMRPRTRSASPGKVPGPGSYDLPSSLQQAKITIKGKAVDVNPFNTPGPGSYSLRLQKSSPAFSIGNPRKDIAKSEIPGPGSYDPVIKSESPAFSMGVKSVSKTEIDNREYNDLPSSLTKQAISIAPKAIVSYENGVPGPGQYEPVSPESHKGFVKATSTRDEKIEALPGPGEYDPLYKTSSPSFSIGKKNSPEKACNTPGPGQYTLPEPRVVSPVLKGKPKEITQFNVPGPGSYNLEKSKSSQGFFICKSARPDSTLSSRFVPGPGSYRPSHSKTISYSFSKEDRAKVAVNKTPGPGSYDAKLLNNSVSYSFLSKLAEIRSSKTPGPGSYEAKLRTSSPSYSCGLSSRPDPTATSRDLPGPGTYDSPDLFTKRISKGSSPNLTQRCRLESPRSLSPGPAAYHPKLLSSSQSFSITARPVEKLPVTPGPGAYDPKLSRSSGFSIGQRTVENIKESPGPGAYDNQLKSVSPSWTMKSRNISQRTEKTPGPGQYVLRSTLSSKGGIISKLNRKTKANSNPPPGVYDNIKFASEAPAFSLGKGKRIDGEKAGGKTPGPGAYKPVSSLNKSLGKFGKAAKQPNLERKNSAGFHKVEIKPSGPFYTIQGKRRASNRMKTPGPGSYDASFAGKSNAPAFSMAARREFISKLSRNKKGSQNIIKPKK